MLISVIIINYNTFRVTCECIESVIKHTRGYKYEIVLVDNCSPNDNPDDFLLKFPSIRLIKNNENSGFAKGNNIGIENARGNVILLLNSDTVLTEDSISIAANELLQHNDVGALGVRMVYTDGKLQHTARKFRSIRNEILDTFRPLLMLIPYQKRSELMLNQYFKGDRNVYCDWVSGAFMMFHTTILAKLPAKKLDDRFFMYGEDQLWCLQMLEKGYRSFYVADTTVIHIHNASTAQSKQLVLLKKFLTLELKIMEYRVGKSTYYHLFSIILTAKEMFRYYIKRAAYSIFRYRIR